MYDINLHSHSLASDGALLPSELCVRYLAAGYKTIAITDHVDYSNIKSSIKSILEFTEQWPRKIGINVLPGVELTHLPLEQFKPLAQLARKSGIKIIVAHGETIVEPVIQGSNRAALDADIDILAHPGLISDNDVKLAKEKGIFLEITSRAGHRDTNTHVAEKALKIQAKLILNNDSHSPEDIIKPQDLEGVAKAAGLSKEQISLIYEEVKRFIEKKEGK
ncbi:MAG: histidinol phosphate phosphatase domain-containing protein [Candidatus Omnitrophota bacterium]